MATIGIAKDECKKRDKKGLVVIYQPHQNIRQHEVRDGYKDAFLGVDKLFWLPTYLTREDPDLVVITPKEFIDELENKDVAEVSELGDRLEKELRNYLEENYLILLMTAGPADKWFREIFKKQN